MSVHANRIGVSEQSLALMTLVEQNNAVAVERWLATHADADVNAVVNHRTALHAAIVHDNVQLCRVLLRRGASLASAHDQKAPLSLAAQHGSSIIVAALLEFGALRFDAHGEALLEAVRGKHADVAACLLNAGASTTHHNYVFMAVSLRDIDTCRILLHAGARPDLALRGTLPLHTAACNKEFEILKLLLTTASAPSCLNTCDGAGWTPFQQCLLFSAPSAVALECIARGADLSLLAPNGYTCALLAVQHSSVKVLRAIIECSPALMDAAGTTSYTPLRLAVLCERVEAVKLLLACGCVEPFMTVRPRSSIALMLDAFGTSFATATPTATRISNEEATDLRRSVLALRHTMFRRAATEALMALQSLDLPAWVALTIVDQLCPLGQFCEPLHIRWRIVCQIKHFHDKQLAARQQSR
jgi:ankyrin repeat protein